MFTFSLTTKSTKTAKNQGPSVTLTEGIMKQVTRGGLGQAQVVIHGVALDTFRGPVTFTVGDREVTLMKGDTHCVWANHQKTAQMLSDFEYVFNLCHGQLGVKVPVTVK